MRFPFRIPSELQIRYLNHGHHTFLIIGTFQSAPRGDHIQLHLDEDGRVICSARYRGQPYVIDGCVDRKVSNYMRRQLFDLYDPGAESLLVIFPRAQEIRKAGRYVNLFAFAFAVSFGRNAFGVEKLSFDTESLVSAARDAIHQRRIGSIDGRNKKASYRSNTHFAKRLGVKFFNQGIFHAIYHL